MIMRFASAYSVLENTADAASASVAALIAKLGAKPELLLIYATENHATDALIASVRAATPGTPILGSTSCGGVMTEAGFHSGQSGAIGILGVSDPGGAYGVGSADLADDAFAAGATAIETALAASGRDFESPVIVWCCQPPGREEAVLAGIQSVIGPHTPIIGGSSADEQIAGAWREFSTDGVLTDHVVVAVWFPTMSHGAAFQSGYAPTGRTGTVTRAEGRQVMEIDGRSASEVYSVWTNGDVPAGQTGMILAKSTPTPLGRLAGEVDGVPMFVLSHPAMVGLVGDLSLFTDIAEGDQIMLMRGSPESLVKRAAVVVDDACAAGGWAREATRGGLVIYCGGCMLHVRDRMDEVAQQVGAAMHGAPFLGAFTFGEQGAIVDSSNRHGNLMVSGLMFGG
jgi:hypothetical protein